MNGKVKHYVKLMRMKRDGFDSFGDINKYPMKVVELIEIIDNLFIEHQVKENNGKS